MLRPLCIVRKSMPFYQPYPPDLPLPASEPAPGWTLDARCIALWGKTQWHVLQDHRRWAERFGGEFGFNCMIMLPPDGHAGAVRHAPAGYEIDDRTFGAALESFRGAGLRIILYSSIMHCGHSMALWHSGEITRQHPDWRQVGAEGNPIVRNGGEWLCPSSPAFDFTLKYTLEMVGRWRPDAVHLDNNGFNVVLPGYRPTCYCVHCQRKFREYVVARFGSKRALSGVDDLDALCIPVEEETDLFRLWIHWRNRVWAESNEKFRAALREVDPEIVFLANVQFGDSKGWGKRRWARSCDLQLRYVDIVKSEAKSKAYTPTEVSKKTLLGKALGGARAVWNYLGTFDTDDLDRRTLRSPDWIEGAFAGSLASGAQPYVLAYGFLDPSPPLDLLRKAMQLTRRYNEDCAGAARWTTVASVFTTRMRAFRQGSIYPPHLDALREAQIPVQPVLEADLPEFDLKPYGTVVVDGVACLTEDEMEALARWAEGGGTLVATADVGGCDEAGRERPGAGLADRLGVTQEGAHGVGRGRVVWCADASDIVMALHEHGPPLFRVEPGSRNWEVTAYHRPDRIWIHVIHHEIGGDSGAADSRLKVQLPEGIAIASAEWWTVDGDLEASATQEGNTLRVWLLPDRRYAILRCGVQIR